MENLSYYHIFYTTAKTGNISRAAEELFMSQPAVSKAIKNLEGQLNTTLFFRKSRGVSLTKEGELLYRHIASAFSSIEEGELQLKRNQELEVGHLHIGVSTTLCKHIMLPLLQQYIQKNPHVAITIDCLSSSENTSRLVENKLDLGLVAETNAVRHLTFTPLSDLSYTFVASPSYLDNLKLREKVDFKTHTDLFFKAAALMLMDEGNISRQHVEHYFRDHSIETGQILETSNMELLVEFAKIGLGVACVIRDLVEADIKNGTLTEIPLKQNISQRTVGFAYSQESAFNPSAEKFRQMIHDITS